MPTLIDRHGRREDVWQALEGDVADAPQGAALLVPLSRWLAHAPALRARAGRLGVLLEPSDDPAAIADDLQTLALIAVRFPLFNDGRGYSIARTLRQRYGWQGELRAVGDVLRDQLFFMRRCGFNAYALREDHDPHAALASLRDFSEVYQAATDQPLPLFRRR